MMPSVLPVDKISHIIKPVAVYPALHISTTAEAQNTEIIDSAEIAPPFIREQIFETARIQYRPEHVQSN